MIEQIDHVNLVVRDLDSMVGFYCAVLGCRVTKNVTISGKWIDEVAGLDDTLADVVYLDLPAGPRIELIHFQRPVDQRSPGDLPANAQGIRHLAFRVSDIETTLTRLRQAGVKPHSPIATVPETQAQYEGGAKKRLVYFRDPEGNLLELCEYKS